MRYVAGALAIIFVVAATPADIAPEVTTDGFHVDPTVSATDECVEAAIQDARADGGSLYVVVLADEPEGGASEFSAGLLELVGQEATIFTVAPSSVDYADSQGFWTVDELDEALAASKQVASDNDVVRTFVNNLVGGDAVCANSSTEGKSGWAYIVMLVIIFGGIIYLATQSIVKSRRRRRTESTIDDR
jgi:hypothetical protein